MGFVVADDPINRKEPTPLRAILTAQDPRRCGRPAKLPMGPSCDRPVPKTSLFHRCLLVRNGAASRIALPHPVLFERFTARWPWESFTDAFCGIHYHIQHFIRFGEHRNMTALTALRTNNRRNGCRGCPL